MKFRKIILMLLLISVISPTDSIGQFPPRPRRNYTPRPPMAPIQNNTVEFDLLYEFFAPKETDKINLLIVLPQTTQDRQKILSIKYSHKPSRTFRVNGNRYAEFVFFRPEKRTKLKINVKARLFRYDLLTALETKTKHYYEDTEFQDFLKQEKGVKQRAK